MFGDRGVLYQGRSHGRQAECVRRNSSSLIAVDVVAGFAAHYQSN